MLTEPDTVVPIIVVADLEFSLGVIAACIPTLMPLFKRRSTAKSYSKMSGNVSKSHNNRSTGNSNGKPYLQSQVSHGEYPLREIKRNTGIIVQHDYIVAHDTVV